MTYTYKLYTFDNQFIEETIDLPSVFTGIVESSGGTKAWYFEGKYHRLDGPAIEWANGSKEWIVKGEWHRLDGPAIECFNGLKLWYVYDKLVTKKQCKLLYSIMKLKGLI